MSPRLIPELKQGHYSDGHPLDEVHYLECKIILKPDRFTSKQGFLDFAKIVSHAADEGRRRSLHRPPRGPAARRSGKWSSSTPRTSGSTTTPSSCGGASCYEDGFPVGDPEIVFKFRHPDLQKAADLDVRPHIPGVYKIKFKAEALPLKDKMGGMRVLYSHNAEFGLSQVKMADRTHMATLVRLFPCLAPLKTSDSDAVELVNQTIVEEVLFDLGKLDFGKGVIAKNDLALWRAAGRPQASLVGEYAFQAKFDRKDDLHPKVKRRVEEFFLALQNVAHDWVSLGTTKTGHRLPPQGQSAPGA